MKRIAIIALAALICTAANAKEEQKTAVNLTSTIDSLSYSIGLAQSNGLVEYLTSHLNVDTAYMDQFIKGLNEVINVGKDKEKQAYLVGMQIGQQIVGQMMPGINNEIFGKDTTQTLSMDKFVAGFTAGATGKNQLMTMEQAGASAQELMQRVKGESMMKVWGEYKAANEKWLADNAKKEGVKTLPSGVQYKVITEGNGENPTETSKVVVDYEGKLIDGTVFDSSYERGEPATFGVNQVISGWTEALCMMPVGSKWEVYIPASKAYGEREQGPIKPFSTLIFTIELKSIEK